MKIKLSQFNLEKKNLNEMEVYYPDCELTKTWFRLMGITFMKKEDVEFYKRMNDDWAKLADFSARITHCKG